MGKKALAELTEAKLPLTNELKEHIDNSVKALLSFSLQMHEGDVGNGGSTIDNLWASAKKVCTNLTDALTIASRRMNPSAKVYTTQWDTVLVSG